MISKGNLIRLLKGFFKKKKQPDGEQTRNLLPIVAQALSDRGINWTPDESLSQEEQLASFCEAAQSSGQFTDEWIESIKAVLSENLGAVKDIPSMMRVLKLCVMNDPAAQERLDDLDATLAMMED